MNGMGEYESFDLAVVGGSLLLFDPDRILHGMFVGIKDGIITKITPQASIKPEELKGCRIIDADNRLILPGFIDFHSHVDGKLFSAQCLARQGATTTLGGGRSYDGLAVRDIQENGFLINHGFFTSHSFTLRKTAGIDDPYREASEQELKTMIDFAEKFLENGAFGLHFGLEFVPGTSEKELLALSQVAKDYGRTVMIHMRKDGTEALSGFDELFRVIETTGVSAHLLHLTYMVGVTGVMEKALAMIDRAREVSGCGITADTGLYDAFPTCLGASILDSGWQHGYGPGITVENLLISSGIYAGQFCSDQLFEYLREEFPNTLATAFVCQETEIARALKKDYIYVSTNAADGPHYEKVGHPETAGTFPRLFRKHVKEEKLLSLAEAVGKITCLPARRFGISRRGEIKVGYYGDLVIIDMDRIYDRADYVSQGDPNSPPDGIDWVIVNGVPVVEEGRLMEGRRPGRMLDFE